jgi:acyl-CoA synthetase (AMP-forming)/AMP-acid ligase II
MISFGNLWHNMNEVYLPAHREKFRVCGLPLAVGPTSDVAPEARAVGEESRVVGVSWLPQFHDTGLVLCIAAPFVGGYRMVNFSPLTFLKSPLLWLKTLSKYASRINVISRFYFSNHLRFLLWLQIQGTLVRGSRLCVRAVHAAAARRRRA